MHPATELAYKRQAAMTDLTMPRRALDALSATLDAQPELSELTARRFTRDLERIEVRLRNGDYEKSPFEDNVLNLPDRTHQVTVEAEFMAAVGRQWARLLEPLGLRQARRALDLGPGWAPKVELGLYYGGFRGHAVLINQDASALGTLRRFLSIFDLEYSLSTDSANLLSWQGDPGDLVLANHLLDDLRIDDHCRRTGTDPGGLYARESDFRAAWEQILRHPPEHEQALVEALADAVARMTLPGGHAVFVQYPSYAERTLSLVDAVRCGQRMLRSLGRALERRGFTDLSDQAETFLHDARGPFEASHCLIARHSPRPR